LAQAIRSKSPCFEDRVNFFAHPRCNLNAMTILVRLLALVLFVSTEASRLQVRETAVDQFLDYLEKNQKQFVDAKGRGVKELVETILEGVRTATNAQLDHASFDDNTLKLNLLKSVNGEIGTKSRVPVQWRLDKNVAFSLEEADSEFDKSQRILRLKTSGFFALPFEGLQIYANSDALDENWPEHDVQAQDKLAAKEAKAVYEYFEKSIERERFSRTAKYYFDEDWLKKPLHKVAKVWYTIREMYIYSTVLGKKERRGEKALYPLLLAKPMRITGFEFSKFEKTGVRIAITQELDETAHNMMVKTVDGNEMNAGQFHKENHLAEKALAFFDPDAFPGQRKLAESQARSAMNYASAIASGDPKVSEKNGNTQLPGGEVKYIVKFFKACAPIDDAYTKYAPVYKDDQWEFHDKTYHCQGLKNAAKLTVYDNPGRVVWTEVQEE